MLKNLQPLVRTSFFLLLWMSWLRLVLFLYTIYPDQGLPEDLAMALFTGFRFDLLVLGFIWIPIWVLFWSSYFFGRISQISGLLKIYMGFVILTIAVLSVFNFYWFRAKAVTMNYLALSQDGVWAIVDNLGDLRLMSSLPLMILPGFFLFLFTIWKQNITDYSEKRLKVLLNLFFSLLIVASCARGTWTAHHLELQHAQISTNKTLNQLVLNPLWNLDKN